MSLRSQQSFTLLELLIVIGILGILGVIVVLVLNPAALFSQARDANRISEILNINKAINIYQTLGGEVEGTPNTVYISIPSDSSTCAGLDLPSLPLGWSYQCKNQTNFRNMDSTGWIPINFTSISAGSPFSTLPVDPTNDAGKNLYYAYITGGGVIQSYEILATLESEKYLNSSASKDNGTDPTKFEEGNDFSLWTEASGLLGYWALDGNAQDSSGNSLHGSPSGSPTYVTGQINQAFNTNTLDHINIGTPASLQLTGPMTVTAWVKISAVLAFVQDVVSKNTSGWSLGIAGGSRTPYFRADGIVGIGEDSNVLPDNQWFFLTGIFEPSKPNGIRVYMNGVEGNSSVASPASQPNDPSEPVQINLSSGGAQSFNLSTDEVRIYNRVLSDEEITAMYLSGK